MRATGVIAMWLAAVLAATVLGVVLGGCGHGRACRYDAQHTQKAPGESPCPRTN